MQKVHSEDWGREAYWLLQIRGQKDNNRHEEDTDSIQGVLEDILVHVQTRGAYTFVDVGVEIHGPEGYAVLPQRNEHTRFLTDVLGINPEDINYKMKQVDPWSGVEEIVGARWNFSEDPLTNNRISYAQLYTSDKTPLYNASMQQKVPVVGGIAVLKMKDANVNLVFLQGLYANLTGGWRASMPVVTRLEARVPLRHAVHVFDDAKLDPRMYRGLVTIVANRLTWCVWGSLDKCYHSLHKTGSGEWTR
jgi:hypothetical protein